MATPPSVLALLALICMALLVIPSSAFVPTFPATSHTLRLRSASGPMVVLPISTPSAATSTLLQMSGGKDEQDYLNEKKWLNPNNDEKAGSRGTDTSSQDDDDDNASDDDDNQVLWGVWGLGG
ncbi:hypothetical protein T484DRAFT_1748652 [Baffinella frigidus]|nr:hypothetical protein T484DRAFT_1748652 [Cryptophyta sp. CCMP2293]